MLYRIVGSSVKFHVMADIQVLSDVIDNLTERFDAEQFMISSEKDRDSFTWDPGGALYLSPTENKFIFNLEGLNLVVRSQHWSGFLRAVKENIFDDSRAEAVYGGRFFKLYGSSFIVCLSRLQRTQLLSQLAARMDEYTKIAKEDWGHRVSLGDEAPDGEYLFRERVANLN